MPQSTAKRSSNEAATAPMRALDPHRSFQDLILTLQQFWGGQGYMWENPVSQFYRDLRLHSIGGGADEVMLKIISKMTSRP